jgi:KH-domain-like of EngA bacterial GTPase enzymes, C-terminal
VRVNECVGECLHLDTRSIRLSLSLSLSLWPGFLSLSGLTVGPSSFFSVFSPSSSPSSSPPTAKSGEGTRETLARAVDVYKQRQVRLSTHRLNELVKRSALIHKPPSKGRRKLRVRFATQSKARRSPTFVFFVNHLELVSDAYRRFMENMIRNHLAPYPGTPLRVQFRQSRNLTVSSKGQKRQWTQSTLPAAAKNKHKSSSKSKGSKASGQRTGLGKGSSRQPGKKQQRNK